MKRSLIVCFILTYGIVLGQSDLFVSSGSYIYVDGAGFASGANVAPLYVTDDVNLASNSHIYLRNEAQLLQGNNVGNSGEGELSVYQEGNVNRWSYNYWCSPVGNTNVDNNSNRNFIFQQQITEATGLRTNVVPTFTFNVNGNNTTTPITISNRWIHSFVSSDEYAGWAYIGEATDELSPGLGFTMKGTSGNPIVNQSYDFRGKPNTGTIGNPVAEGLSTLIGNPYPSAIDALEFINDTDNQAAITGTLFYWEQDVTVESHILDEYIGGYAEYTIDNFGVETITRARFATYDSAGNVVFVPPGPPGGTKDPTRYIPIGQGFMVQGSVGTSGTVRMKNSYRVFEKSGANSIFFRVNPSESSPEASYNNGGLTIVPENYKRFRVNVDFAVNDVYYTRQLVFNFNDNATFDFDYGMELTRADNLPSDAYFSLDNDIYSAQAYPYSDDLQIPIVVDVEQQQPLRFRIFDIQNFEDSQGIYIHDTLYDIYINLRENDHALNIEPGHYPNRFKIVFTSEITLSNDEVALNALAIRQNNGIKELQIFNPNSLDISKVELYDITGREVIKIKTSTTETQYNLSTRDLSSGVYIATITTVLDTVKSEKVIIKN